MAELGGTPEQQAAYWEMRRRKSEQLERDIAAGKPLGDVPDPLTEEDEEILDRVWAEPVTDTSRK